MVETIGEDLGGEIVRDQKCQELPLFVVERLDKSGISDLFRAVEPSDIIIFTDNVHDS